MDRLTNAYIDWSASGAHTTPNGNDSMIGSWEIMIIDFFGEYTSPHGFVTRLNSYIQIVTRPLLYIYLAPSTPTRP